MIRQIGGLTLSDYLDDILSKLNGLSQDEIEKLLYRVNNIKKDFDAEDEKVIYSASGTLYPPVLRIRTGTDRQGSRRHVPAASTGRAGSRRNRSNRCPWRSSRKAPTHRRRPEAIPQIHAA